MNGGAVNYLKFLISGDSSQLETELNKSKRTVTGFVDGISSSMGKLGPMLGSLFAGLSIAGFVGKLVSVQREFDVLNSSLVTVTGSVAAAGREMAWIKTFAKETPFGLAQATEGFVKMKALGLNPTREALTSFGNTASAMGKDLMQMIEAVADASTGEFERLKEFGIKASKEGEQVAFTFQGVTTRVKNSAEEITSYLESIGNSAFGGAMERRAKTLDGAIAGLGDTWDEFFRTVNESTGFSDAAAKGVNLVTDAIDGLGSMINNNKGVVMAFVGGLGGVAVAAGVMAVASAIGAVKLAVLGLAGVLAANPITLSLLVGGAVAGAGIAVVNAYAKTATGIEEAIASLRSENERSEAALGRAMDGGRTAGADNIRKNIEARKEQIAKLRSELDMLNASSKGAGGGRGSVNPPLASEQAAKTAQAQAGAEKDLADIRRQLYGVNKDYLPQLQKLQALREKGSIGEAEYVELVNRLAKSNYKEAESSKARGGATKQMSNAYGNLVDQVQERIAQQQLETEQGEKLSESDKIRIKYQQDLKGDLAGLTAAQRSHIDVLLGALSAAEKENAARKEFLRLSEAERQRRLELAKAAEQTVTGLLEGNQQLRNENELIGLTATQQAKVLQLREEIALAVKEQHLAEMRRASDVTGFMSREQIALEQEIELRRERLGLLGEKGAREASKTVTDQIKSDWDDATRTMGRTLADYIMGGGKDAAQYLKRLFATLVLEPVVQYGANAAMGALGLGQQGKDVQSVLGGNNVGTTVLNNSGLIGAGYQAMFGASVGASSASLLGANAVGLLGGDAIGTLAAANGMWAGVATGAQAAAQAAIAANVALEAGTAVALEAGTLAAASGGAAAAGGGAAAAGGAGISGALAAVPVWGWIALAGIAILSQLDLGSRGANHSGAAASSSGAGNDASAAKIFGVTTGDWYGDVTKRHNPGAEVALAGTVGALEGVYNSLTKHAGETARQIDVLGAFVTNGVHKDEDAYGYGQIRDKVTGEILDSFTNRELGSDPEKAWETYVGQMGGLIVQQLKAADLPGWMNAELNKLGDDVTIEGLNGALQQIGALSSLFDSLTRNMNVFAGMTDNTFEKLINGLGGFETATQSLGAFYQEFYTESERAANTTRDVTAALATVGIAMPQTRAEFRDLVQANIALGDAGASTVTALIGVSGAFASVVPVADEAKAAVDSVTDVLSETLRSLLDERRSLEADFLRASGDQAGADWMLRDIATAGYTDAERAAWDMNEAIKTATQALDELTAKEAEKTTLQQSLAEITGKAGKTAQGVLEELMASVQAIESYRANLSGSIESMRLQTMTPDGRADYLRNKEQGLWSKLDTALTLSPWLRSCSKPFLTVSAPRLRCAAVWTAPRWQGSDSS